MIVRVFRLAFPVAIVTVASFASLSVSPARAADAELNVYNWSEYIAKTTIPDFQKQTGVHVRYDVYDVYDSDDTLQSKLLAGSSGYDIVVPTSNYMARQIQAGVYQKLDKTKLPNLANLDPALMKKIAESDPGNQYGAPLDSWALVFDPANVSKLKSCGVSFLDAPDDVFAAALQYLGKDPNSKNPADYHTAFDMLKKVRPYITQFNSSGYNNDLANNDVCVVLGWSGDVSVARREAAAAKRGYEIRYANPKEGGILWFDVMAIPKDAPHPEAALQWINYIQDPKVNADITNEIYYPSANKAAHQYVTPAVAHDPNVYLTADVLDRMTLSKPRSADIARLENCLWQQLKTGN
ncbi:MAG: extracellular solute-binding protein [Burkholderia sp.]|jgi:putative spermidine/putrescine transport system substrate-binding protein/putrescine transport system substrate-binding protein|uniref:extracellular solute-binding protein n=2 Tax=Burkholderia sp. TaxID=36773 RepID=UPI00258A5A11|nr:extracellular solute-binding protein [Burkholderia sp.]MCA3780920.1 extracellular solute-binding protein [Burkholderia sp.]MCA3794391.1 extracellular solute-binding protein [Burkholderia sp.]MCA3806458.1 extracellular solute-binding protein [Burkholderia sp.]MCA3813540.1 extracellular solute-binding protein [Burkholderia sp.]MCA3819774.1 extracellular solute-binding protein [Burkholderia sp.]